VLAQNLPAFNPDGSPAAFNLLTVDLPSYFKEYAGFATLTGHVTDRLAPVPHKPEQPRQPTRPLR